MRKVLLLASIISALSGAAGAAPPPIAAVQLVPDAPATYTRARTRTIYLNHTGSTLTPGQNDSRLGHSSLVTAPVTIPAWNASPTLWANTVACMREVFAPFDVAITDTDPGDVPHVEAIFGGSPATIGVTVPAAGISPFSTTCSIIESSIVFTFTDVIPQDARVACEVMAQEVAHSYGLDHELLASDPMTYLPYAGHRAFQNTLADCGESTARPCGPPGFPSCRDRQNSYALLMERIGAAGTGDIDPPTVAIGSPIDHATVKPGFTVTATISDDVAVTSASLAIDGEVVATVTAPPWTFHTPADLAAGAHVLELTATDGKNEQTAMIDVTVPDGAAADGAATPSSSPLAGCSAATGGGPAGALAVLALVALRRRRR